MLKSKTITKDKTKEFDKLLPIYNAAQLFLMYKYFKRI